MKHSNRNRGYLHGAAILAAAVAIVRVLGAIYRIPIADIIGAEGMGIFTIAASIYTFLLLVSTAGLPVALSRMVAAADSLGRPAQVRQVFVVGRNTFVAIGLVSFLIMAVFHRQLADFFGSPTAAYAILALSPALFFVGLISAYRGYCQGLSNMVPTSVSQVIEALTRLILGVGLAWLFVRWGFPPPIVVVGAILGTTLGPALASVYLFFAKRRVDRARHVSSTLDTPDTNRRIFKNLGKIAVPLTLGASIFSFITILDNAVILRTLQGTVGLPYTEAQRLLGTYGMILPLFNLPMSFIIPIIVALIPAISAFLAQGDHLSAKKTSESGIRVTCLLALPAGAGLTVLASPIMYVLFYGAGFTAQGPGLMAWMGVAAFFICFAQVVNCVLQAYGFQSYTMITLPVGGLIKLGLTWWLLTVPGIGIYGAAIAMVACWVVISIMNVVLVKRKVPEPPSFLKVLVRPALCTIVMAFAAWASYGLLDTLLVGPLNTVLPMRLALAVPLTGAIALAMVIYLLLIIATKALTREDMLMLPKGERLAKLLRVR